jgi:UDP-glucose 4-epimerase
MRIAITGSMGFLGSNIAQVLSGEPGCELIQNDLDIARSKCQDEAEGNYVFGDLRRRDICEQLTDGVDVLIHMAQSNNPLLAGSDFVGDVEQNLLPTLTLLDTVKNRNKRLHIIFPSSGGTVYAPGNGAYKESDTCFASSPYGVQKIFLENYLSILTTKNPMISASVLRISNPYGVLLPVERKQGFVGVALSRIKHGLPIEIWGNQNNVRDYIHISDLCEAVRLAIQPVEGYHVYNIGAGEGHSVSEIVGMFEQILARKVETNLVHSEAADAMPIRSVLDVSAAAAKLKWTPHVKLYDGIAAMIEKNGIK